MNQAKIDTLIVAPLTSTIRHHYPTRIPIELNGRQGQVVLDQLRAVDRSRLLKKMGVVSEKEGAKILHILQELFS
jgi:mRNA interferase MazF